MWNIEGKTVLVTGATSGIGYETALGLARGGAHVVIVGRNAEKTARVLGELKAKSGSTKLESVLGDLSLLSEVRSVAQQFLAKHDALHVLVNNAGVINTGRELTREGHEVTFATNHLGVFLLTKLLLPALEKGAPSRVVTVSSGIHPLGKIHFDDLTLSRGYGPFKAYSQSKLANILFTQELARRLEGKNVTANVLHPGFVGSNFAQRPGALGAVGHWFTTTFGKTPAKGAATSLYLSTSDEVSAVTGRYFIDCKEAKPRIRDTSVAARLWDVTEQLVSA